MKTLDEIKDEVAKEYGCENWKEVMVFSDHLSHEQLYDEVAKRYAIEAVEIDRRKLANDPDWYFEPDDRKRIVNRPIELP